MSNVKQAVSLVLDDSDWIELERILVDDDADAALEFIKYHLKDKARQVLEGG